MTGEGICSCCREKLPYITGAYCLHCGKELEDEEKEYCTDCENGTSNIRQGRALWNHQREVRKAVYSMKYSNRRHWGKIFGRELALYFEEQICLWGTEIILPIPLHPSKKRKRGYNQAEVIARELSRCTGVPMRTDVLFRIRKTEPQKQLGMRERKYNMRGVFGVSRSWKVAGSVLLVDDIYTTGATVESAAKVLKTAGAENVYFLTVSIGQGI